MWWLLISLLLAPFTYLAIYLHNLHTEFLSFGLFDTQDNALRLTFFQTMRGTDKQVDKTRLSTFSIGVFIS